MGTPKLKYSATLYFKRKKGELILKRGLFHTVKALLYHKTFTFSSLKYAIGANFINA